MKLYIVSQENQIIFVGSCAVDANEIHKRLPGSVVVVAHLNAVTDVGSALLAPPM